MKKLIIITLMYMYISCNNSNNGEQAIVMPDSEMEEVLQEADVEVTGVSFTRNDNGYTFNVRLKSPDIGCDQYANWWEVITEDGDLIYRRILGHSHVTEQPFTRSGGPVSIDQDQIVIVRGHMNNSSYGTVVFKGSIDSGFDKVTIDKEFAKDLETQQPLPANCAF